MAPSSPWRTAAAGGSESAPELLGSSPIPHHLASIGQHLRTEAPSLRRLSPASSVLRASPPSPPTRSPKLLDLVLAGDFPCCAILALPACRLHYPGETLRAPSGSSPERNGLPRMRGGSALASVPFGACSESRYALQPAELQSLTHSDSFPKGFMMTRCQITMPP